MKKILIIDDDVKIMSYLIDELENIHHFKVKWLTNAEKVLDTVKCTAYSAIILDIMLPVPSDWTSEEQKRSESGLSTGLVLFEKIRAIFPTIPIIIYTAKMVSLTDQYTYHLRKPEFNTEIVNHLNRLMLIDK